MILRGGGSEKKPFSIPQNQTSPFLLAFYSKHKKINKNLNWNTNAKILKTIDTQTWVQLLWQSLPLYNSNKNTFLLQLLPCESWVCENPLCPPVEVADRVAEFTGNGLVEWGAGADGDFREVWVHVVHNLTAGQGWSL